MSPATLLMEATYLVASVLFILGLKAMSHPESARRGMFYAEAGMAAAIIGYFGVNAYTGKYGLNAQQELDQEIIALTSELARLKQERAQGEQRVSLLRSDRVDPDLLDERARYQLDYVNPHDLVRMNDPH